MCAEINGIRAILQRQSYGWLSFLCTRSYGNNVLIELVDTAAHHLRPLLLYHCRSFLGTGIIKSQLFFWGGVDNPTWSVSPARHSSGSHGRHQCEDHGILCGHYLSAATTILTPHGIVVLLGAYSAISIPWFFRRLQYLHNLELYCYFETTRPTRLQCSSRARFLCRASTVVTGHSAALALVSELGWAWWARYRCLHWLDFSFSKVIEIFESSSRDHGPLPNRDASSRQM